MQSNKNTKGRAIFSDEQNIREKSLQLYTYLVCHANLRNYPDKFGDNVRIFQQRDIKLTTIKRAIKITDDRTIKKYWEELECAGLIRFCPHGWEEELYDEEDEPIPFSKRWTIRNKHKDTYYEIPVRQGMLFRKIPKETLIKLNEDYKVGELILKVYMTLINYQEECIYHNLVYKRFTYQDLRGLLGYKKEDKINKKLEYALVTLKSLGLIDIEKGSFVNSYGMTIPVFVLNQANFYVNFDIMDFETADIYLIPEEIRERIIENTKKQNEEI